MVFSFKCLPNEEVIEIKVKRIGAIPGNGVAICPRCQRELHGNDYIWRCKGRHAYSGPLLKK